MSTSIYELFHYSLFPGLFVAFTYNKKEPPVFGAAPAFWCILLSFLGLPFRHIPNNLSNDNELTANAPFFYQISGTWSNHEGSILSWCRILSFYGFLLCYRGRPQSHNVSKRGGHRESLFYSFVSNFVKNSILSLPSYEQKTGATTQLYTLRTLVDSELRSLMLSPKAYYFLNNFAGIYPNSPEIVLFESNNLVVPKLFSTGEMIIEPVPFSRKAPLCRKSGHFSQHRKQESKIASVRINNSTRVQFRNKYNLLSDQLGDHPAFSREPVPFSRKVLVESRHNTTSMRRLDHNTHTPIKPPFSQISFAPLGARRFRGSREGKRTHPLLHLARDDKERASSIDEQRIDGALGIALFFSPFLSASSDPFVRNFFVRTEPLAESNPVPQDPISAIHPPCIYAGDVASAMGFGFGLCRSKMMNGIVALHSPPMRKDDAEKNGRLFRSAGCVFKHVGANPALLLRRSLLRRRFAFSFFALDLWTGALVDTGRERVVRNGKKETTTSLFCWIAGANTVVSDQDQEPIRILILTCRWFLTVGILPGSWWAHHELGRGGWWFRDPVENASFMPRVLATARIHSVILPLLHSWTSFLNIVTLPCCVSGTSSIRSGLLAPVHNFATDETRGIFLWWFFLLMTGISMMIFSQMKQQASVRRTYKAFLV